MEDAEKGLKSRSAKVITFYNLKGGVGKTTLAVNFAAWLARDPRKRVLFIDMDMQCNSSVSFLGFDKAELEGNPADYLSVLNIPGIDIPEQNVHVRKIKAVDLITKAPNFRLFAIKGSASLDDYWVSDKRLDNQMDILLDAIETLRPVFDYIVMDTGPRDNMPAFNALVAADYVITPLTCETQALDGVERYFKKIRPACQAINPLTKNILVANLYKTSYANFYSVDMQDLAGRYGAKLLNFKIRDSVCMRSLTNWDFIEKAKTLRCVCTYDSYIETKFNGLYQDMMGFVMEVNSVIAEAENGLW